MFVTKPVRQQSLNNLLQPGSLHASLLNMSIEEGPLSALESSSETSVSGVPKKCHQLQVLKYYYTSGCAPSI